MLLLPQSAIEETAARLTKADEIKQLRVLIKRANTDYHTKGKPKIADATYDKYKDRLAVLAPNDPLLKTVGAAPMGRAKKVQLPTFMGSLDKLYDDAPADLTKWLKAHKAATYLVTDKLDGISALLQNVGGRMFMYTRGDGSNGTDISHLIPHLKFIPKLKDGQMVRGEIVISKADFKKNLATEFKNPRNLAAGITNKTKVVHKAAKYGQFIIHEMIKPKAALPRVAAQLTKLGGKVVNYKVIRGLPTMAKLETILDARKSKGTFEVDGIVIDDMKGHRIAIKKNEAALATVKEVKWETSQHGYKIPVVWFDKPVRLSGADNIKATGHNAKFIKDGKIGPGAVVSITRGGDVIPKILDVVKGTKASFPPKGTWEWAPAARNKTEPTHIISTDENDLDTVNTKKMVVFLTNLGVKGFKINQLSLLYEAGINTPSKLVKATAARFQAAGIGPKQSQTLYAAIKQQLTTMTVPKMMVASRSFPRGFGLSTAKDIYSALGDSMSTLSSAKIKAKLSAVNGLGEASIEQFLTGLPNYSKFIATIDWKPAKKSTATKTGSKLAGKTFVFTGFRDAKLQEFLERNGAKITSSVSKNTSYLVRNAGYSNEKTKKAAELKIKQLTPDQARNILA